MKVYYGNKGSEFFIMCTDFKEIYVFDMFGNVCRTDGYIDSCNNWQLVDILSFVQIGVNNCEVLYNGYTTELGIPLFEAIKSIRLEGKYLGTMFNIPHEDDIGRFSQIIFVFPRGTMTSEMVNRKYPNRLWKKLKNLRG